MTESTITITTTMGSVDVTARASCKGLLAVHETATAADRFAGLFTLTHVPTGYAIVRSNDRVVLDRIAVVVARTTPIDVLRLTDPLQVVKQMPAPVGEWLATCRLCGWTEPPAMNGRVHAEAKEGKRSQPAKDRTGGSLRKRPRQAAEANRRARARSAPRPRRKDAPAAHPGAHEEATAVGKGSTRRRVK